MVSVFVISTGDNWQDIMYVAMDSVGDGRAPSRDHSSWAAACFVLVVLVAMLFWANLFVSALVDNFKRMAANGATLVSAEQQTVAAGDAARHDLAPRAVAPGAAQERVQDSPDDSPLLQAARVRHGGDVRDFPQSAGDGGVRARRLGEMTAQEVFDYFTFFYVLEACLLVAAMGWKMYWSNFMYRVDFVVALVGFLDFAIPSLREAGFGDAFRVARFLRLVKLIKDLARFSRSR